MTFITTMMCYTTFTRWSLHEANIKHTY